MNHLYSIAMNHLTRWIPVPPDIYWTREWAEDAAPMLYRHEGLPYTGRIVGQRHDRTREQSGCGLSGRRRRRVLKVCLR